MPLSNIQCREIFRSTVVGLTVLKIKIVPGKNGGSVDNVNGLGLIMPRFRLILYPPKIPLNGIMKHPVYISKSNTLMIFMAKGRK